MWNLKNKTNKQKQTHRHNETTSDHWLGEECRRELGERNQEAHTLSYKINKL